MRSAAIDFGNWSKSGERERDSQSLSRIRAAEVPRLLILAPSWPGQASGYGFAIRSTLSLLGRADREIHYLGVTSEAMPERIAKDHPHVEFTHIPIDHGTKLERFVRSLASRHPAAVIRFLSGAAGNEISDYLARHFQSDEECCVLFEDLGCSVHLERIASQLPRARFAARTHNVLATSFNRLRDQSNLPTKLAWSVEIARLRRFEVDRLSRLSRAFTITDTDRDSFRDSLGLSTDGVVGVSISHERYANTPRSDPGTIVWLGTADARKGAGLRRFVEQAWPVVLRSIPSARLLLAGRGTEGLGDSRARIEAIGPVVDDRSILGRGGICINPQESGSGIKVKSLVAMAAGRALVSTPVGVEGIPGISGGHYMLCDTPSAMAESIVDLVRHPRRIRRIGDNARALVAERFSDRALHRSALPLLEEFLASPPRV